MHHDCVGCPSLKGSKVLDVRLIHSIIIYVHMLVLYIHTRSMIDSEENGSYRLSWVDVCKWKTYCKPVNQGGLQASTVLNQ